MTSKTMTLKPRVTEKSHSLALANTVYVFDVPKSANKLMVAEAVATQFEVTVESVRITRLKGKPKRTASKGRRPLKGQRSDFKKAYVTLKKGDKLPFFDEPEKESKKSAKKEAKS